LLAEVNAARQRLAKVPAILKRFRPAVLAAACSGRLTEEWRNHSAKQTAIDSLPASWSEQRLADVSKRVTDGTHLPPPLSPTGIPFILIGNIVNKRINWDAVSKWISQETYERLTARCRPERGDVLYTAVGATFGQALAVETDDPFIFQRHIAHIKPDLARINTFLVCVLNSPRVYSYAQEVAKGAAQPTVTLTDLKEFSIPIPPLPEQHEIVRRVEALFKQADQIEAKVSAATARVEKLTQAILAKAFRGELVTTEAELARREGRDYEPASVLLERIRKDKESVEGRNRSTKPRR
jgi:type I restriction enzyme, S subunit